MQAEALAPLAVTKRITAKNCDPQKLLKWRQQLHPQPGEGDRLTGGILVGE
jgi:hypothetical protein